MPTGVIPKLTHEQRAERRKTMAMAVRDGVDIREIARTEGVSLSQIHIACREHGVQTQHLGKRPLGPNHYTILAALFSDDSCDEIGRKLGIDGSMVQTVYRRCIAAGVPVTRRRRGRPTSTRMEEQCVMPTSCVKRSSL
jgi:transposase